MSRSIGNLEAPISISHTFNTFLFRSLSRPLLSRAAAAPPHLVERMQFEVLATCHTTRARVSRMKLARGSFNSSIVVVAEAFQMLQMG